MKETIKLGAILLIIAAVSGIILAFVNGQTAPIIAEQRMAASVEALELIFEDADEVEAHEKQDEIVDDFDYVDDVLVILNNSQEVIGHAIKARAGGYGGDVVTLTAIDIEGNIAGIEVIENSETPGLGTAIVDNKDFGESFIGKTTEEELVSVAGPSADNEVLLLSGATVSTNAVVRGVNRAVEIYNDFLVE